MTRRSTLVRMLVLAAALLGTGPFAGAEGQVKRGVRAPPFDTTTTVDLEAFDLEACRGRFVFLQFFSVHCTHCQAFAPRMNEIRERFGHRGLHVVGVTHEPAQDVRAFQERYRARYPVAIVHFDVLREYGIEAYPAGFLVAPNGRLLWRGDPNRMRDAAFDAYLKRLPLLPDAPAKYGWVSERIRDGRFADVLDALELERQCRGISKADCRFVLGTLDWIDGYASSSFKAAESDENDGRLYDAWWTYDHIARGFGTRAVAVEAAESRDALMEDPARGREIEAWRAFVAARRRARTLSAEHGAALLDDVARTHKGTPAAVAAGTLAREWVAK